MKKLSIVVMFFLTIGLTKAQEYKVAKASGRLEIIDVNEVLIEGYSGNEIVFTAHDSDRKDDERAKGLRAISNMGLEDNSGLGLSVVDKGDVIEVRQLKKMDGPDISIKVPKGVIVSYQHNSPYGNDLKLKNLENEIEISTMHNSVVLDNVSGPMSVKTVHGDIDAIFGPTLKNPISVISVHGHVDVTLPTTTKANLKLSTAWGEIFVDPQLKIEMDKSGNMVKHSDNFAGKLNGGGLDISLSSTHSNVYVRKK